MKRNIIKIDQEKCNGCGLCVTACHEGSIGLVNGKAVLLREDYCDGLSDCLPVCPTGAISMEEREAAAYDVAAVQRHREPQSCQATLPCGCPGTVARAIHREAAPEAQPAASALPGSQLRQWPVQIKLVPVRAPYFDQAHLLIAADCSAYAYGNFHHDFIKNRITLIGCPKLDEGDYSEKLSAILAENDIKSLTVVRMEVPCCGGLEKAAVASLKNLGKMIPLQVVTISSDGRILA